MLYGEITENTRRFLLALYKTSLCDGTLGMNVDTYHSCVVKKHFATCICVSCHGATSLGEESTTWRQKTAYMQTATLTFMKFS